MLYDKINLRVDKMLSAGLLEEAREFAELDPDTTACQAIGYKELAPFIRGEKSLDECVERLKIETRRYAKRQLTWFRKNENVNWFYPDDYNSREELLTAVFDRVNKFLRRDENAKA